MYAVISCSLNPDSKSRILGRYAHDILPKDTLWVDLRDYTLPFVNGIGNSAYTHPQAKELHDLLLPVKGFLFACPIYNYNVSAATKGFIELLGTPYQERLTGNVFREKVLGLMSVGGGTNGFMASLGFLNSCYLDFQSYLVPNHIFVQRDKVDAEDLSQALKDRIVKVVRSLEYMTERLK